MALSLQTQLAENTRWSTTSLPQRCVSYPMSFLVGQLTTLPVSQQNSDCFFQSTGYLPFTSDLAGKSHADEKPPISEDTVIFYNRYLVSETTPTTVAPSVLNAFRFPSSSLFNPDVIRALNIASSSPGTSSLVSPTK